MAYSFQAENFEFTSNSSAKVETVRRWFTELGYTVEKIKNNEIQARHKLMNELSCWGHCKLANEYWEARDIQQSLCKDYIDSFPKLSSARVFAKGNAQREVAEKLFELTGWRFV